MALTPGLRGGEVKEYRTDRLYFIKTAHARYCKKSHVRSYVRYHFTFKKLMFLRIAVWVEKLFKYVYPSLTTPWINFQ